LHPLAVAGQSFIGSRRTDEYFIDRIFSNVEQCAAAVEWSRAFRENDRLLRGYEFYEFDPVSMLIREIRGYYAAAPSHDRAPHELVGFDYDRRGYKTLS
jgi:methyltransferase